MHTKIFFITASNTNIGKTYISTQILSFLKSKNKKAIGIKPLETGVSDNARFHCGADLNKLYYHSHKDKNIKIEELSYLNAKMPVAPALAANIDVLDLQNYLKDKIAKLSKIYDYIIIEGAGGVFTPIARGFYMVDLARNLQELYLASTICVIDDRLGCINNALSAKAVLEKYNLRHRLFINLQDQKNFELISAPYFRAIDLDFSTTIDDLLL